ncbi:hypothetical protein PAAG_05335 [Paracoccidioides lutzii Pb01]|uniref:Uncharacterized protein n=1 Tax=Paracoccidioides lutzii (strain ATCC MYA-826 / Pb01) TaxID=502779 RepID=C1H3J2_PARBA|nr:hypothetical protein PAAG_05335 [Paracoccidioides lutzii Pb01]EEH34286.2 hypothetical protein PAAG_05335 [Paracoccidioides lutzii Pb01]
MDRGSVVRSANQSKPTPPKASPHLGQPLFVYAAESAVAPLTPIDDMHICVHVCLDLAAQLYGFPYPQYPAPHLVRGPEVACIIDGKQACCPENEIPLGPLSPVGGEDGEGEEGSDSQSDGDGDGITQRYESKPERKVCKAGEKGKLYRPEMQTMVNGQLVANVGDNLVLSKKDSSRQDQQMTFRPSGGG